MGMLPPHARGQRGGPGAGGAGSRKGQSRDAALSDLPVSVPAGVPCSGGQLYLECGRPCGQTCAELRLDGGSSCPDLDGLCIPGCNCPAGLVLAEGGQCVPPADCPCRHGTQLYPPGSQIRRGCNAWCVAQPVPEGVAGTGRGTQGTARAGQDEGHRSSAAGRGGGRRRLMKSPYGPFGTAPRDRWLSLTVPATGRRCYRQRACLRPPQHGWRGGPIPEVVMWSPGHVCWEVGFGWDGVGWDGDGDGWDGDGDARTLAWGQLGAPQAWRVLGGCPHHVPSPQHLCRRVLALCRSPLPCGRPLPWGTGSCPGVLPAPLRWCRAQWHLCRHR